MADTYILTKEFYEEHPLYQEIINTLKLYIDQKVEFVVQVGDTTLVQFVSFFKKADVFHSYIESGHLLENQCFIYLKNELNITLAVPLHKVKNIHYYSHNHVGFKGHLYEVKLLRIDE